MPGDATTLRYGRRGGGWLPTAPVRETTTTPGEGSAYVRGGWDRLVGMTCTCPPGCTTGDTWGDGSRECAAGCEPCSIMRGKPYVKLTKADRS